MIELASMAVVMPEVVGHPNRTAFRGVLTVVDARSQRAPSGAKGHLVVLTRVAAEAALASLLGMALDYAPTFDRHDVRRKVGVITRAELVGRKLEIGGYLFARDFPEIVEEIAKSGGRITAYEDRPPDVDRQFRSSVLLSAAELTHSRALGRRTGESTQRWPTRTAASSTTGRGIALQAWTPGERERMISSAGGAGLGMSYEVADVQLADTRARVWTLTKVTFTGAAILRRDKAAYQNTWIELG
jgi:hypothetical protein